MNPSSWLTVFICCILSPSVLAYYFSSSSCILNRLPTIKIHKSHMASLSTHRQSRPLRWLTTALKSKSTSASPTNSVGEFPTTLLPPSIESWSCNGSNGNDDMSKLILYQDKHIIAVYKPPTILSQPVRVNNHIDKDDISIETLMSKYLQIYHQNKFNADGIHMLQRLDRPCSGILLFAISDLARQSLTEQFQQRSIDKRYLCVVNGEVLEPRRCDDLLLKSHSSITKVIASSSSSSLQKNRSTTPLNERKDCVQASLSFRPIESISFVKPVNSSANNNEKKKTSAIAKQTVLEVKLESGRKHQIRAQLSHQQLPIVGDVKYGAPQRFTLQDIALHAYFVRFRHPVTKQKMSLHVAPPRIWDDRFKVDFSKIMESLTSAHN